MAIQIIEKNLDYISINYQFSYKGSNALKKYIRDEIVSQVIADTTLIHNKWTPMPNRTNMFRSTGGMSLIIYSNKFIIQVSGEAFLFLDDSDIQDILRRAKKSIQQNRKFDIENDLRIDNFSISVGRIDSQITIAIPKNETDNFFNLTNRIKSGRERIFRNTILGESVLTGKSWTKNNEKDVYLVSPDDLKKEPQPSIKKRDFIRIYDKLREVIETTLPHSDKRHQLTNKYSEYIRPDVRIFRVEIQENDRRLTTMLDQLLDHNDSSFKIVCDFRFKQFAKRNPFKMWKVLLPPDTAKVAGQGKGDPQGDDTDLGSYV